MKKLVLTGAAGRLGTVLRAPLAAMADELVSTDRIALKSPALANETFVEADLADLAAVEPLLEGADMVVHFGAIGDEAPFDDIFKSNMLGSYSVWEAAHRQGVGRVVYASSIHAVGMHPVADNIGVDAPHRPDTFYGLAKCFSEDLARLYWEKRGVEAVCLRILSCADVTNARALGTWLSYDDLIHLVTRSIVTRTVGMSVVYGVSNNDRAPVNNIGAGHLGYRPKDNGEVYADKILAAEPPADPSDLGQMCVGGPFATVPLGESGTAFLNLNKED